MSLYEQLPIYKRALDLTVYFNIIVRHFDKHCKYTVGADLCNLSREILILVARANAKQDRQAKLLEAIELLEELKILIHLCKEIRAFRSSKSFEFATQKTIEVAKQCEGWLRSQNSSLRIRLHPKRHKLLPISNGIDFLGYIIRPQYILVRRRVVNNLKEKIRQFRQAKVKNLRKLHDSMASYLGHFRWANSYRLIEKLNQEVY